MPPAPPNDTGRGTQAAPAQNDWHPTDTRDHKIDFKSPFIFYKSWLKFFWPVTNLQELQLKDRAKRGKKKKKRKVTKKESQKQKTDFSRVVLSQLPALTPSHEFLPLTSRFMSKIRGFHPIACHKDSTEELKMLQEPPCFWTHGHWIWTSSPQSIRSIPPPAFHNPTATNSAPPTTLVSVPSWEPDLRIWWSTQQGSEQCSCLPIICPYPLGMALRLVAHLTCSFSPCFYKKVV